jgi:hypothetical protein
MAAAARHVAAVGSRRYRVRVLVTRVSKANQSMVVAVTLLFAGCVSPGDDTPDDADARCPEGSPLGMLADKPTVAITIDGVGPFTFVYDTGAPYTVIDTSIRGQLGDGPFEIGIAGRSLVASAFTASDIAKTFGFTGAQGILGTEVLGDHVVTIDRQRARIWIDDELDEPALAACTHVSKTVTHASVTIASHLYVQGRAEDVDGWFVVDSGATLGAITKPVFDDLQARHPRPALSGFYTPAGIGPFWADLAAVGSLEVGSMRVEHVTVRTVPVGLLPAPSMTPFLGLLPNGFLHHALMTVDYRGHTIRWAPYLDDEQREGVFAYSTGIGLAAESTTPSRVDTVLAGSAAAEAGVVAGDVVTHIGGTRIEQIPLSSRSWMLTPSTPGPLKVTVQNASGARTLTLESRDLLSSPIQ